MTSTLDRTSYDEVPYPSYPYPQTHPGNLATLATLLGLSPPPTDRCRVLELGCASGGNLIPLALTMPECSFVGIDMSRKQIAAGQQVVQTLELPNIQLLSLSILDFDAALDSFDYILCHGVYSWVPYAVQQKILEICARHLVANGIGYISYNTHPGWRQRGTIRDMMQFHVGRYPTDLPQTQIQRARELLKFLVEATSSREHSYALLLKEQLQLLQAHSDSYVFHEHLEEHNEPVWFLEFCERLGEHGLRYLGETDFGSMVASASFSPETQQQLDELAPNLLEKEQYMDFVRNRSFRQTLICRADLQPNYDIRADRIEQFQISSPVRPLTDNPDLNSDEPTDFVAPGDLTITTPTPIVKSALLCLGEIWPRNVPFETLLQQSQARLGLEPKSEADEARQKGELARAILTAFVSSSGRLVELTLLPSRFVSSVSQRPTASPLARLQAASSQPITNLRHEVTEVTPVDRHLLPFLDGTREFDRLVDALVDRHQHGLLDIRLADDQPVVDADDAHRILNEVLHQRLPALANTALFIA